MKKTPEKQQSKKEKTPQHPQTSRSSFGICVAILLVIVCLSAVVVILIPCPIKPIAYSMPETLPKFEDVLEPNDKLAHAEKLYEGQVVGPESLAVDSTGTLYAGLADGRIVKFEGNKVVDVVRTGTFKPGCGSKELEHTCGRPLGMRFDRYGAKLFVADAYFGLLEVDPRSGTISTLVPPTPGIDDEPFRFINDLDIGRDGTIYFTDSSSRWERRNFGYIVLEGDNTGRLLQYNPKTGDIDVLISGLNFANGVQLSHEGDSVLVVETVTARILKYYLRGEDEGKVEVFADNLPGLPDNIRLSSSGGYWVGLASIRKAPFSVVDFLSTRPWLRAQIAKLFPWEILTATAPKYALVIELSSGGSIQRSFHDPGAKIIHSASEVHEEHGYLYFGSYNAPYLARLKL